MARKFQRRKARRKGAYARIGIWGPPGGGKTFTGLKLAHSLIDDLAAGQTVAWVDTEVAGPEQQASEEYADLFPPFELVEFREPFDPRELGELLHDLARDFPVIGVDSMSHFWAAEGGTIDIKDTAEREKFRGNSWAAWSVARPEQDSLIRAIQTCPAHLLVCMRGKDKTQQVGKEIVALGNLPIQDPGIEFEFNLGLQLDPAGNVITVAKSRYGTIDQGITCAPGGKQTWLFGQISEWLDSAEAADPELRKATGDQLAEIERLFCRWEEGRPRAEIKRQFLAKTGKPPSDLTDIEALHAINWLEGEAPEDIELDDEYGEPIPSSEEPEPEASPEAEAEAARLLAQQAEIAKKAVAKKTAAKKAAAKKSAAKKAAKRADPKTAARKAAAKKTGKAPKSASEASGDNPGPDTAEAAEAASKPLVDDQAEIAGLLADFFALEGDDAIAAETILKDQGFWPITEIDATSVDDASEAIAFIVDEAMERG